MLQVNLLETAMATVINNNHKIKELLKVSSMPKFVDQLYEVKDFVLILT